MSSRRHPTVPIRSSSPVLVFRCLLFDRLDIPPPSILLVVVEPDASAPPGLSPVDEDEGDGHEDDECGGDEADRKGPHSTEDE